MDLAERVALAVLAGAHELERVADLGGERDAAGLVAASHGQGQLVERVVARVGEHDLLRQPDGPRSEEGEGVGAGHAEGGQEVPAAASRVEVDAHARGLLRRRLHDFLLGRDLEARGRRDRLRPEDGKGSARARARRHVDGSGDAAPGGETGGQAPGETHGRAAAEDEADAEEERGHGEREEGEDERAARVDADERERHRRPEEEAPARGQPAAVQSAQPPQEDRALERPRERARGHGPLPPVRPGPARRRGPRARRPPWRPRCSGPSSRGPGGGRGRGRPAPARPPARRTRAPRKAPGPAWRGRA